jgi:hypothetical protein
MQVRVTPAGQPSFETDLVEFAGANSIDDASFVELVGQLNNGLEYVGAGGVTIAKVNSLLPPFCAGDRVLRRDRPWDGSWLVTGCERINGRWRVHLRSGAAEGHDTASAYFIAPKSWEEPPARPLIALNSAEERDLHGRASSEDQRLAFYRRYVAWGRKHLAPLGHADHVAGFERLIGMIEAERAPERSAAE